MVIRVIGTVKSKNQQRKHAEKLIDFPHPRAFFPRSWPFCVLSAPFPAGFVFDFMVCGEKMSCLRPSPSGPSALSFLILFVSLKFDASIQVRSIVGPVVTYIKTKN